MLDKLAKTEYCDGLIKYLEELQNQLADVRKFGTIEPAARLAAIKVINDELVVKLKILSGRAPEPTSPTNYE